MESDIDTQMINLRKFILAKKRKRKRKKEGGKRKRKWNEGKGKRKRKGKEEKKEGEGEKRTGKRPICDNLSWSRTLTLK